MIIGYSIIAVPTGIVTAEITQQLKKKISNRPCPECGAGNHDVDAKYCKYCGDKNPGPKIGDRPRFCNVTENSCQLFVRAFQKELLEMTINRLQIKAEMV